MNIVYEQPGEIKRIMEARDSFSGRLLSNAQFDEAMMITTIIEREIRKSGAFKEKLSDYAYAFSRTENFDASTAETKLRDLFKARTGKSMNQLREEFVEREKNLSPREMKLAHEAALAVGDMIENGTKISFHRAYAHQGEHLALELNITDAGAKRMMKEAFAESEKTDFYEWGKELEEKFFRPQIEAERQKSEERREQSEGRTSSRSRSNARSGSRGGGSSAEGDGEASGRFRNAARNDGGSEENASVQRTAPAQSRGRSRMSYNR